MDTIAAVVLVSMDQSSAEPMLVRAQVKNHHVQLNNVLIAGGV